MRRPGLVAPRNDRAAIHRWLEGEMRDLLERTL